MPTYHAASDRKSRFLYQVSGHYLLLLVYVQDIQPVLGRGDSLVVISQSTLDRFSQDCASE